MKIVIINGYPQSGKDTFIDFLPAAKIWTSTPAKNALVELGWDGETKSEEIRSILATFKQLSNNLFDYTIEYVKEEVRLFRNGQTELLFIHCREPEEIGRLKRELGARTLFIQRDSCIRYYTNSSDNNVMDYHYDCVVQNNGTVESLKQKALKWYEEVMKDDSTR